MVYVISKDGRSLMPTARHGKVKHLLRQGRAKVVQVKPFTIQLNYDTGNYTQDITLGIDAGYENIGFSAVTESRELISGEVKMLEGQKGRLLERKRYRRIRRGRKRHRQCRFLNRKASKPAGWLAPSIRHKLDTHERLVQKLKRVLPVTDVIVEVAAFDIQKIKDPDINGVEYQQGEQLGSWNLREYVLHRDGHKCQNPNCPNPSKNPILRTHHLIYRENGGTDTPSNEITLCTVCHTPSNHQKGKFLFDWQLNPPKLNGFKPETFMTSVHWQMTERLDAGHTFGYITKNRRIGLGLEKTHCNDAFCITGGETQARAEPIYYVQRRRNNRSLEKFYDAKYLDIRTKGSVSGKALFNGRTTRNKNGNGPNLRLFRGHKLLKGRRNIRRQRYFYQPGDTVIYDGEKRVVVGVVTNGAAVKLDNGKCPSPKKLTPYRFAKGLCAII